MQSYVASHSSGGHNCIIYEQKNNKINATRLFIILTTLLYIPVHRDLFWERHHRVIAMTTHDEAMDRDIPEYPLPEQIEQFIAGGKYRNVEISVTRDNYQRRMHNLLYLEEFKRREDMSRWAWQWEGLHTM